MKVEGSEGNKKLRPWNCALSLGTDSVVRRVVEEGDLRMGRKAEGREKVGWCNVSPTSP